MKALLHPRNPHQGRYDMAALCQTLPELSGYVVKNPRGQQTVNFADPAAVQCLNKALLAKYYGVKHWQLPDGYLCPPIPGRADYVHYVADLLGRSSSNKPPRGKSVRVLDLGTGANLIYPIIGSQSYGWQFVGTEIDRVSLTCAKAIVTANRNLLPLVSVREQSNRKQVMRGIVKPDERFDLTMCNPPFHASAEEAAAGSARKVRNLSGDVTKETGHKPAKLNFGGQSNELWCEGGELSFILQMARESVHLAKQVCWFTSLVSKSEHVQTLKKKLRKMGVAQCEVIQMRQGQKISRLIAWSFLSPQEQQVWAQTHWR